MGVFARRAWTDRQRRSSGSKEEGEAAESRYRFLSKNTVYICSLLRHPLPPHGPPGASALPVVVAEQIPANNDPVQSTSNKGTTCRKNCDGNFGQLKWFYLAKLGKRPPQYKAIPHASQPKQTSRVKTITVYTHPLKSRFVSCHAHHLPSSNPHRRRCTAASRTSLQGFPAHDTPGRSGPHVPPSSGAR